jgi:hypothetical protein
MSSDSQRYKCREVASVTEADKREWQQDQQYSLFMNVPAKEERRVCRQCESRKKVVENLAWSKEKVEEWWLMWVSTSIHSGERLTSWDASVRMNVCLGLMSGKTAKLVSPTSPRVTLLRASALTGSFKYGATVGVNTIH